MHSFLTAPPLRLIPLVVGLVSLAVVACDDPRHRAIRRDLHVIATRDDSLVPTAMHRLSAHGSTALMHIEGAMHGASTRTRLRLVQVMGTLESPDAVAVIGHWRQHAPDGEVREACALILARWAAQNNERGEKARIAQQTPVHEIVSAPGDGGAPTP